MYGVTDDKFHYLTASESFESRCGANEVDYVQCRVFATAAKILKTATKAGFQEPYEYAQIWVSHVELPHWASRFLAFYYIFKERLMTTAIHHNHINNYRIKPSQWEDKIVERHSWLPTFTLVSRSFPWSFPKIKLYSSYASFHRGIIHMYTKKTTCSFLSHFTALGNIVCSDLWVDQNQHLHGARFLMLYSTISKSLQRKSSIVDCHPVQIIYFRLWA